jgi:hypothetical protein
MLVPRVFHLVIIMMPLIRTAGAIASWLLCMHSFTFIFAKGIASSSTSISTFRLLHNLADIVLFLMLGLAGLVAELFPKDSFTYRVLKSNFPFLNSLIGRGIFYILLGFIVMGDYSEKKTTGLGDEANEPDSDWGYFSIISGSYISLVGIGLVISAYRGGGQYNRRSLNSTELSQPIVAFIPSMTVLERSPHIVEAPNLETTPV